MCEDGSMNREKNEIPAMRYERKGAAVGSFLLMRSALLACAILCMLGMLAIASLDPACAWAEERIGSINVHALQSNTDGIPAEDGQENHPSVLPSFRFAAGEWSGLRVGEAFLRCSRCKRERSRRYGGCRTSGLVRFQNRRDGRCGNLRVRGAWARRLSSDSGRRHRACPGAEEFSGGGAHAKPPTALINGPCMCIQSFGRFSRARLWRNVWVRPKRAKPVAALCWRRGTA